MRALVTGGAGFIGSHLSRGLLDLGHDVRIVDDLSTGKRQNIAGLPPHEFIERDIASDDLRDLVAGIDVVFHLAAIPSVPRSVTDPLPTHVAAATATVRLLLAARDARVPRFVTSSSSSVYGNVTRAPATEDLPTLPRSPYAVAKLAAEGYTRVFAELYGMQTVSLRYFNVFGPRQDPTSQYAAAIPRFISAYLRREAPHVHGDGMQTRDFTFVANVVEANRLAMSAPKLSGESVNVAAGRPRTVLEVLDAIADVFGYRLEPVFEPPRPGDIRRSHADISLAQRLLGYRTLTPFEDGLRATIEWSRANGSRD